MIELSKILQRKEHKMTELESKKFEYTLDKNVAYINISHTYLKFIEKIIYLDKIKPKGFKAHLEYIFLYIKMFTFSKKMNKELLNINFPEFTFIKKGVMERFEIEIKSIYKFFKKFSIFKSSYSKEVIENLDEIINLLNLLKDVQNSIFYGGAFNELDKNKTYLFKVNLLLEDAKKLMKNLEIVEVFDIRIKHLLINTEGFIKVNFLISEELLNKEFEIENFDSIIFSKQE